MPIKLEPQHLPTMIGGGVDNNILMRSPPLTGVLSFPSFPSNPTLR